MIDQYMSCSSSLNLSSLDSFIFLLLNTEATRVIKSVVELNIPSKRQPAGIAALPPEHRDQAQMSVVVAVQPQPPVEGPRDRHS